MPNEERALATIETILDVGPIENANKIEVAQIRGWKCVVKKGQFQPGDKCVFFEVDSVLPADERFAFLKDSWNPRMEGYRLKTRRMRGQISQGLAMPLSDFPELEGVSDEPGTDVTDLLHVTLYKTPDESRPAENAKAAFPGFIPKSDEERVQNVNVKSFTDAIVKAYGYDPTTYMNSSQNVDMLDLLLDHGKDLVRGGPYSEDPMTPGVVTFVSEKLDGTSFTTYIREGMWGMCSRNRELVYEDGNTEYLYSEIVTKYGLKDKMLEYYEKWEDEPKLSAAGWPRDFAFQGEIIGPGVQKNPYKLDERKLYVYAVFDIHKQEFVAVDTMMQMAQFFGLEVCPFRSVTPTSFVVHQLLKDRDEFQKAFEELGEKEDQMRKAGMRDVSAHRSALNSEVKPEGEVYRPFWSIPRESKDVLTFKVINNRYLLDEE